MDRFDTLLQDLASEHPNDCWITRYQALYEFDDEQYIRNQLSIYKDAINSLDEIAWKALLGKIKKLFKQNDPLRGKQQFFNQLNEALAYKFLKNCGYSNIVFISEGREKTPDNKFEQDKYKGLCEVKTINKSKEEYDRVETYDSSEYANLGEGFINKFKYHIDNALEKMPDPDLRKLVYLIVHFDDVLLSFFWVYEEQILSLIKEKYPSLEIFIQVGLVGNRYIHYVPNNS